MTRRRYEYPRPYRTAFTFAAIVICASSIYFSAHLMPSRMPAEGAGEVIGVLVVWPMVIAAGITGFFASRANYPWSTLRIGVVTILIATGVLFFTAAMLINSLPR